MQENLYVVIMAGGGGLRLWPASTRRAPKQFLDLLGVGRTLLQSTFDRAVRFTDPARVLVITAAEYVPLVHEQLPELPQENILGEPRKCNTAPCLALAAMWIVRRAPERAEAATMLVLSSDHHIPDHEPFAQSVTAALAHTTTHPEALITFGLKPLRPETGYGYIHAAAGGAQVTQVLSFKEKPDFETAQAYCQDGVHFWNSGIFVWRVRALLSALERFLPQVVTALSSLQKSLSWTEDLGAAYAACPEISIDHGILERSAEVYVVRSDFAWSDLGSWRSIAQYMPHDAAGNARQGTVFVQDSHHNILHTPEGRLVATIGLEGYVVAWHGDSLLICPAEREQEIRQLVKGLEEAAPEHV